MLGVCERRFTSEAAAKPSGQLAYCKVNLNTPDLIHTDIINSDFIVTFRFCECNTSEKI